MEVVLRDTGSKVLVSDIVFGSVFNHSLVHQVVTSYLSSGRQGTRAQKSRSSVSGSGKKPWRQKGTGRARAGSIRSPIWRSGGVTFAACPKDYKQKINKKMYRGALRNILSELFRQNRLVFVSDFYLSAAKTKILVNQLYKMDLKSDVLILVNYNSLDSNLFLAARNLYKVKVCCVDNINPYILVAFNTIIITFQSIKGIEDMLI